MDDTQTSTAQEQVNDLSAGRSQGEEYRDVRVAFQRIEDLKSDADAFMRKYSRIGHPWIDLDNALDEASEAILEALDLLERYGA